MLNEYQTALILADDIIQAIAKIADSLDLAISINCPDKKEATLVKQGGQMACDLLTAEIEQFKLQAAQNLIQYQQGTAQA